MKSQRWISSFGPGPVGPPDEGVSDLVVDRIGDNLPQSTEKSRILVIPVGARHKCQQVVALVMVAAGSRRAIVRVIEEATHVWFEEPVADEKRRRLIKWKRCVSIATGNLLSAGGAVGIRITPPGESVEERKTWPGDDQYDRNKHKAMTFIGRLGLLPCWQLVPGSDRFRKENGTSREAAAAAHGGGGGGL
ncbi:hypothetical protein F511_33763 [Dorcoceras hygrometricum]|uniref:Uncharacterized protein n=1 Tax=Dorcoceras hygrometricum TaxID=472368 RepID=A0A2Z7DH24_9LAMI|nr:hypothetical protein F511_33763 [Dorcoceras hygrometricum]